ncbi:hypothetical protein MMC10_007846 [Thelotrema lepadinum]|nr:hypothetical protein [Thelotrema lepadinum]
MDSCGVVSPIVTNLLVGLDASDISTIHYNEPLGATYFPLPNQWDSSVTQLNIQDLACPTFGLGNATTVFSTQTVDGYTDTWSDIYTTFGPPYKPIIIVPPVLLSYRSEWISTCGNYSYTPVSWIQTFGIVDPPQPLTPQAVLSVPQTTPAAATTVDPQPPVTGADPGTKPTMFSPSTQPQLAPTPSPQGGSGSNGGGGQNGGGSNDKGNPAVGGQNPGSGSAPNNGNPAPVLDPGVGGIIASMFGIGSPTNRNPSNPLGSGSQGSQGDPGDPGSSGSDDGSFNDNSSGGSPPADSDPPGSPPITSALAYPGNGEPVEIDLGGHIFTIPAASEIILGPGTTLTAAGPAATLLGSVYSVNAAGYVIVSATGDDIGSPTTPQESLSTITFAGQVLTVGPNDVIVDGTTLFPHSIITVSGTVIYLGGDGMLDVGLSSTSLFPNSFATLATTTPEVVTLDGEIFTLEPSGLVVVDGTTLTVGQGATISGKPISVESGGAIVVGSQTATESAGTPPSKTGAATASSSTSGALKLGGGWTVLLTMVAVSIIGLELTTS